MLSWVENEKSFITLGPGLTRALWTLVVPRIKSRRICHEFMVADKSEIHLLVLSNQKSCIFMPSPFFPFFSSPLGAVPTNESTALIFIAPAYSKVRYRVQLSVHPSIHMFIRLFICLSIRLSTIHVKVYLLWSSDSWEYETMHSNYAWHTLEAGNLTWCPWPAFHAPLTLSKFCVE